MIFNNNSAKSQSRTSDLDFNNNNLEYFTCKYELNQVGLCKSIQKPSLIRIDSIISTHPESNYEKEKEVKIYSENGQLNTHTFLYFLNSIWENNKRIVYSYNGDGQLIESLSESWGEVQWNVSSKMTYTYFDFGEIHKKLEQSYINGIWVNTILETYDYETNNKFNYYLFQIWENGAWMNFLVYDIINGDQWVIDFVKLWHFGEWVKADSVYTKYNEFGNYTHSDAKKWVDNEWVNGQLSIAYYDPEQRRTSSSTSYWDENEYVKSRKDSMSYNEYGIQNTRLTFFGNQNNEWEHLELRERIFDDNQNLVEEYLQLWENNQWNNSFYGEYFFENGSISGYLYEWRNENWYISNQQGDLYFVLNGEQIYRNYWENKMYVYYSDIPSGLKDPLEIANRLIAYPNPTAGLYYIKMVNDNIQTIDVYQLNSQLVASYRLDGSQEFQLDLSDMPNGIYMIKVQSEKHTTVLKTVKSN